MKQFYFSICYNLFFCAPLASVFHLLRDFHIDRDNIVAICFSLLQKFCSIFHGILLNPFIGLLIIFSRWFFSFSYIWKKNKYIYIYIYRKIYIKKWFKMFNGVNMTNFFKNHKKVLSKSLKNCLNILKIMLFATLY